MHSFNTSKVRHRSPFLILAADQNETSMRSPTSAHIAIGLEGSDRFAAMAREQGFEILQQNFLELNLPNQKFDGVFANASLFHVPSQELPRVLRELHATLKSRGALFSSNPRGNNEEGWNKGRYGAYHDFETWRGFMTAAGFVELTHYYRPAGLPRAQQPW